jgi:hypothetical protein
MTLSLIESTEIHFTETEIHSRCQFRKAYCGPLPPSYHVDPALMKLAPTKVCLNFGSWPCVPSRVKANNLHGDVSVRACLRTCVWCVTPPSSWPGDDSFQRHARGHRDYSWRERGSWRLHQIGQPL